MSISNKLTELNGIKQGIKQAIVDKGVDMTGKTFDQYAGAIQSIQSGGVPLEQFISFDTDYSGSLYGNRLLTFLSRNPYGWDTPVDIKIYYKNDSNEDILLVSKRVDFDTINFIVIPRSYGNLKIVMSLVPDADYGWSGFSGFYAKTAKPNVVTQLTAPSGEDDFVLSYVDFDVFHVVFTAYGD